MKLRTNRFKQGIGEGTAQVGIRNCLCSKILADALASAGYDWALLDMEHSSNDVRTVLG